MFPKSEKKLRASMRMGFRNQSEALIAYAELKMSIEVRMILNNNSHYGSAKNVPCLISWLTRLRIRGSTASSNVNEQNPKQLCNQIINPDHHKSVTVFNLIVDHSSPTIHQIKCDLSTPNDL